jgi:hypothetical protein
MYNSTLMKELYIYLYSGSEPLQSQILACTRTFSVLLKDFFWLVHHFRTFGLIISSTCNFPPLNKIFFGTTMILLMFKSSIVFEIVANQPQRQCNYQYTNSFLIFFIYFASAVMAAGQEEGAGGRGGSPAYSKMELLHLLDIMERIIPVSGEEWDQVDVHHCTLYPVRKA